MDCSYNSLKSLDGLQYVQTLEILRAEHNQIIRLQFGSNGASEDKEHKKGRSTSSVDVPSGDPNSVAAARLSEMTAALKESRGKKDPIGGSILSRQNSKGSVTTDATNINSAAKNKKDSESSDVVSSIRLVEVHLRGNRLKSLEGLVNFGTVRVKICILFYFILCYLKLYYFVLYYLKLSYFILYYVMLCYVI